jgi:hypothetical protein
VVGTGVDQGVVVAPGGRKRRGQCGRLDGIAPRTGPNGEEVKVKLDQGLTGVERDDLLEDGPLYRKGSAAGVY